MTKNNTDKKIIETFKSAGKYTARWLYFAALIAGSIYGFWIWNKYVLNVSWSEEKKNSYIQEQSVFSFDKAGYEKTIEYMKTKKERLGSQENYSGRDLFFPE